MDIKIIFILSLLSSGLRCPTGHNLTFLPQLKEFCPYSSFCEENATYNYLENDTSRPCCSSCSCKPGCEVYDNCCFDLGETEILRKCTSPVLSRTKVPTTNYVMIHSCLPNGHQNEWYTICKVNVTDYKSFAPVTSTHTGDTFVNSDCAFCNEVYDYINWRLALECPNGNDDHSLYIRKLLLGEETDPTGCHLTYIPPKHTGLQSRECVIDAIRECNVTGRAMKREPFWEYCSMFNATYSMNANMVYGNIFCYICNTYDTTYTKELCSNSDFKYPMTGPFTSLLDGGIYMAHLDVVTQTDSKDGCGSTEALVQSFKAECRPVLCPWGQFRIGGECGFYSAEWIGGPFTAVLKLTPIDRTDEIDTSLITNMDPGLKYNTKAKWLKRNAMKDWNVATLYRPSDDRKYVNYLVAKVSYPGSSVNPARLRAVLKRTLEETWQLVAGNKSYPLKVQFDRYGHYVKRPKQTLMTEGQDIDDDHVYINTLLLKDSLDQYLLEVYYPRIGNMYKENQELVLNELFLCNQIEIRQDEFEKLSSGNLLFKVTNVTLYVAEYRITLSGDYSICLNRFNQNRYNRNRCFFCMPLGIYVNVIFGGLVLTYVNFQF